MKKNRLDVPGLPEYLRQWIYEAEQFGGRYQTGFERNLVPSSLFFSFILLGSLYLEWKGLAPGWLLFLTHTCFNLFNALMIVGILLTFLLLFVHEHKEPDPPNLEKYRNLVVKAYDCRYRPDIHHQLLPVYRLLFAGIAVYLFYLTSHPWWMGFQVLQLVLSRWMERTLDYLSRQTLLTFQPEDLRTFQMELTVRQVLGESLFGMPEKDQEAVLKEMQDEPDVRVP